MNGMEREVRYYNKGGLGCEFVQVVIIEMLYSTRRGHENLSKQTKIDNNQCKFSSELPR